MTIYDRHLVRSYLWILTVLTVTTFGLFCVIDLMDNFDDFWTRNEGGTTGTLLFGMGRYYGNFAFFFFDSAGRALAVLAAITLLILLDRGGELKPLLAAGVPTYRIAIPIIVAVGIVNVAHVVNREFLIPPRAHLKYAGRGDKQTLHEVEGVYDHTSKILIDGNHVIISDNTLTSPQFVLPSPNVTHELTTLNGTEATFHAARGSKPAGWVVKNANPPYSKLQLTPEGREIVVPFADEPANLFVKSSISSRDLFRSSDNATMLSTVSLLERIRNPSFSFILAKTLILHFHQRMVAPFLNVACVLIVIPLMIRKNSTGLVANTALSLGVVALLFGVQQGFGVLGQWNLVSPAMSAWGPLIACGGTFAGISDFVQT